MNHTSEKPILAREIKQRQSCRARLRRGRKETDFYRFDPNNGVLSHSDTDGTWTKDSFSSEACIRFASQSLVDLAEMQFPGCSMQDKQVRLFRGTLKLRSRLLLDVLQYFFSALKSTQFSCWPLVRVLCRCRRRIFYPDTSSSTCFFGAKFASKQNVFHITNTRNYEYAIVIRA